LVTRTARLTLHGWFYDILTGRIEVYDEVKKRFSPLAG
jgi:carbonic anhydrase